MAHLPVMGTPPTPLVSSRDRDFFVEGAGNMFPLYESQEGPTQSVGTAKEIAPNSMAQGETLVNQTPHVMCIPPTPPTHNRGTDDKSHLQGCARDDGSSEKTQEVPCTATLHANSQLPTTIRVNDEPTPVDSPHSNERHPNSPLRATRRSPAETNNLAVGKAPALSRRKRSLSQALAPDSNFEVEDTHRVEPVASGPEAKRLFRASVPASQTAPKPGHRQVSGVFIANPNAIDQGSVARRFPHFPFTVGDPVYVRKPSDGIRNRASRALAVIHEMDLLNNRIFVQYYLSPNPESAYPRCREIVLSSKREWVPLSLIVTDQRVLIIPPDQPNYDVYFCKHGYHDAYGSDEEV
eukprot:gene17322-26605_t